MHVQQGLSLIEMIKTPSAEGVLTKVLSPTHVNGSRLGISKSHGSRSKAHRDETRP